jgi:hypothetical protein
LAQVTAADSEQIASSADPGLWGPRFLLCKNHKSQSPTPALGFGSGSLGKSRRPQRRGVRYACWTQLREAADGRSERGAIQGNRAS